MVSLEGLLQDLELLNGYGAAHTLTNQSWGNEKANFSPELQEKLNSLAPDAVYFYNDYPFLLFYDFSKDTHDARINDFHKKVWCFDKAPIVFVIESTAVRVYNAFQYTRANGIGSLKELTNIHYEEIVDNFKFWKLKSGETWRWLNSNVLIGSSIDQRVNRILFDNIKQLRHLLTQGSEKNKLNSYDATILILRLIFIRYLIDRDVSINPFITGINPQEKRESFNNVIANEEQLFYLFDHLRIRFNDNDLFVKQIDLSKDQLTKLSYIFQGQFYHQGVVQFMFDVFDFNIISVETISGIYESVINVRDKRETGAIYTPPFLVDFIFSKTVNRHIKSNAEAKILDPACGSGIFLVQAYRKIIHNIGREDRTIEKLIKVAEDNLFGIDRDIDALNVAVFSIYVAILDFMSPVEITSVPLPKLKGYNLFRNDFFNEEDEIFDDDQENFDPFTDVLNGSNNKKAFDFIIGNPPWGRKNDKIKNRLHLKFIKKHRLPISGGEISQTFLIRAKDFTSSNTVCAFVVTSKAFHNANADKFRTYFFKNFTVHSILDLSIVRHLIFEDGDYPATVIVYTPNIKDKKRIYSNVLEHISLKPSLFLKIYRLPLINEDDIKTLRQSDIIDHKWLLKTALYGSYLDINFIKKLINRSSKNSLLSFLKNNKDKFEYGDGVKGGKNAKPYPDLIGQRIISSNNIKPFYTYVGEETPILTQNDVSFERGRTPQLFDGEKILFRLVPKDEENIFVSYNEPPAVFKHGIVGITSKNATNILKGIYGLFISRIYNYFIFLTSSSWGVARPDIRQEELLSFPYIGDESLLKISKIADIFLSNIKGKHINDDYLNILHDFINKQISESFGLNNIEEDLINYVSEISRYYFRSDYTHSRFLRSPNKEEVSAYATVFYDHFQKLFENDNQFISIDIHQFYQYTAMHFKIDNQKSEAIINFVNTEQQSGLFKFLVENFSFGRSDGDLFVERKILGFESTSFYVVKPSEIRFWHKAMAHKDVTEFEDAMIKADLERLEQQKLDL